MDKSDKPMTATSPVVLQWLDREAERCDGDDDYVRKSDARILRSLSLVAQNSCAGGLRGQDPARGFDLGIDPGRESTRRAGSPTARGWTGPRLLYLTQGGGALNPPPDLRHREHWGSLNRDQPDGWAWSHLLSEKYRQFCGIIGGGWFAQMADKPDGLNSILDAFNATTGWSLDLDQALETGHRSMILQSLFGTQRGWFADFDWRDVGPRFLEPIPDGRYKGFTIAKWLPDLVYEYYRLSGRHERTGRPLKETLLRLGLEEFMEWSQPEG